ncbi:YtfJ family protein [Escherichia coli]|uniref:YtfJ family protein n=1 Tax=Escherichia coli TaxID=562 RepID=UPI0030CBCBB6
MSFDYCADYHAFRPCRHTISSLAKRLPPVYIQEGGELLLNSDDEIHYQKWNSTQLAGKVRINSVYRRA